MGSRGVVNRCLNGGASEGGQWERTQSGCSKGAPLLAGLADLAIAGARRTGETSPQHGVIDIMLWEDPEAWHRPRQRSPQSQTSCSA